MNHDVHERASQLLMRRRIEALACEDEQWLAAHLAGCETCAAAESHVADALASLRTVQINIPRDLVSRTQLRVRLRADELREHGGASRLIWAVAVMSWLVGLGTAPVVFRGFEWMGDALHLPKLVWISGMVLWWLVPALVATGIVLFAYRGQAGASE